jgi:hypothetical protein
MPTQTHPTTPTIPTIPEPAHQLVVLSRHHTSQGTITYTRCTWGALQIWHTSTDHPAPTLLTTTPKP